MRNVVVAGGIIIGALLIFRGSPSTVAPDDVPNDLPSDTAPYRVLRVAEARGSTVYALSQAMSTQYEHVGYVVGNASATGFTTASGGGGLASFVLDGVYYDGVIVHRTVEEALDSIPYPWMPDPDGPSTDDGYGFGGRGFGDSFGNPFDYGGAMR